LNLVLGLDCSGETYSAGLWGSAGTRLEVSGSQPRRALRELPEAVAYLLRTAGAQASDLSAVGVTSGPGSFTGVRLGITVARTAALLAGCPACGWDTL
jgi:tRNA threonylcarbamoyladenosine biosynthesis protein TsaB